MRISWVWAALIVGAVGCSSSPKGSNDGGNEGGNPPSGLVSCVPDSGVGSAHFVIDPKDGKCKLDGTTTNVGATCSAAVAGTACGTDQNAACLDQFTDDYPNGYCNVDPCTDVEGHLCPIGASCAALNGENPQCFKDCSTDSDCRKTEGYFCLDMTADKGALWTSGASYKVCVKPVLLCPARPADCPSAFPRCALPDGGAAFADGGATPDASADDGAATAPITGVCRK